MPMYNYWYQDWNDYVVTTYSINKRLNGIELSFANAPSARIRGHLKKEGWKWSYYSGVWYTRYSEDALHLAQCVCSLTEKRRELIAKMPKFYRDHCGYSEDRLLQLSKAQFDKVAKYGTLKDIAKEILVETLPEASLSYLSEIYLRIMRDEQYREEFIKKIPKNRYYTSQTGKRTLSEDSPNNIMSDREITDSMLNHLMLKQSRFWDTLAVFGGELRPIDRTAFEVSNFRDSYASSTKQTYWKPSSRKEYHLFIILGSLTLDYDDLLTRTIKAELHKELELALSCKNSNERNYFLLAIYSHITGNEALTNSLLDQLIEKETAKSIILKKNRLRAI